MPRENSFSDSDGRSLTPDLEVELPAGPASPVSPTYTHQPRIPSPSSANHTRNPAQNNLTTSIHSHAPTRPTRTAAFSSPKDRFRATVRKVIQLHRSTTVIASRGIGAEPGIDPRRQSAYLHYGHLKQDCVIEIGDYSAVHSSFGKMTNREFVGLMKDPGASAKEPWVKVRWINIGGISWDVISAVALKYDLHPLALEDVLHQRDQNRSKADYYPKHLFLRVLCHQLVDPDEEFTPTSDSQSLAYGSTLTGLPRSASPSPFTDDDKEMDLAMQDREEELTMNGGSGLGSRQSTWRHKRRRPLLPHHRKDVKNGAAPASPHSKLSKLAGIQNEARQQRAVDEIATEELKKGERVNVKVLPMFIFLLRDGTVITIQPTPNLAFTSPIAARLRQPDTVLRSSADPSLLVQSLLDLIVDGALEVIDEYHHKIKKFERDILLKPKMKTVRNLHILSGDLILHKRTLEPIKTVIYGLRRYDVDRCAALVDTSTPEGANAKIVGFMSHKAKIYLADVFDHMDYILTSLDMFAGISDNLVDYTFNMVSYEMNEVMRRLTLVTIVCLPLTLLTGYFGMNFENMWSIMHGHSDIVFWIIAIPLMCIVLPLFITPDLIRMLHYVKKRLATRTAVKIYRRA